MLALGDFIRATGIHKRSEACGTVTVSICGCGVLHLKALSFLPRHSMAVKPWRLQLLNLVTVRDAPFSGYSFSINFKLQAEVF